MTKTTPGFTWLRVPIFQFWYVGVCKTKTQFSRELKRLKLNDVNVEKIWRADADAATYFFEKERKQLAIVVMNAEKVPHDADVASVVGLVAHEIIHVWQSIKEDVGENNPGHEMEAYYLQALIQEALYGLYWKWATRLVRKL